MYIVTDLTRFKEGNPKVCTALVDMDTGECVRPMPYFPMELMRQHNILPGAKFSGNFSVSKQPVAPHIEDRDYSDLKYHGPASAAEFKAVLDRTIEQGVSTGFGYQFAGTKVIPAGKVAPKSIITVKLSPSNFMVEKDNFDKFKVNFTDSTGAHFRYIPITDLGFYQHVIKSSATAQNPVSAVNAHFNSVDEVYLRIGLSRAYDSGASNGYWLQVNGIYSFPGKLHSIRGYAP